MVHLVLYGPAISQSDSMKACPNELPLNKDHFRNSLYKIGKGNVTCMSVIVKCNVIEMTIYLHTIKGVIRIKNSTCL